MTTSVDSGFDWSVGHTGRILQSPPILALSPHLFTTRDVSFRGPGAEEEEARLAASFGLGAADVSWVTQVHGRAVCVVQPGVDIPATEADAIVSTDPARAIAVRVADCVPILIADRKRRVVAAVHAGWRGTCAGAALAAVETIDALGIPAGDLVAALGPSIGPCCYDVDDRVRGAFLDPGASPPAPLHAHSFGASPPLSAGSPPRGLGAVGWFRVARTLHARSHTVKPDAAAWFTESGDGRWTLDLRRANVDQLVAAGVPADAIHVARLCTKDNPDTCFSYRRDGPGTGRLVAAIRLGPASAEARSGGWGRSPQIRIRT